MPPEAKQSWTDSFQKIEVKQDRKDGPSEEQEINIVLTEHIDPKKLPYAQEIDATQGIRMNNCMVVARGDGRTPEKIFEEGGFHPQYTNPNKTPKRKEDVLDILEHRRTVEEGSGFVSFTTSPEVAKKFARDEMGADGYVYFTKATGAVTAPQMSHDAFESMMFKGETEYAVPGGVDAEDIVAIRKKGPNGFDGPLFVSKAFMEKYPEKVKDVVDACLESNERALTHDVRNKHHEAASKTSVTKHDSVLRGAFVEPRRDPHPQQTLALQKIAGFIETNAVKMQPTSSLTRTFYKATTSSKLSPAQKEVAMTAKTIQQIYAACKSEGTEELRLLGLKEAIKNKVAELQAQKSKGKLYKDCEKSSLSMDDLKADLPGQYKFVIALHLALQEKPPSLEKISAKLSEHMKQIGWDVRTPEVTNDSKKQDAPTRRFS